MKRAISALSRAAHCGACGVHSGCLASALVGHRAIILARSGRLSSARRVSRCFERLAYLNAGTDGPLPTARARRGAQELQRELDEGARRRHFERASSWATSCARHTRPRSAATRADVALTTCTSEGIAQTIDGLELGAGDEILTSDEEHPGLLGALGAARELRGVSVREVPLAELAEAVGPRTRLVACSHVGWVSG